jgi:hypothetical protein
MTKVAIGRVCVVRRDLAQAVRWFDEALEQAESTDDMFATTLAITNRAWMWIALGHPRGDLFERNLVLATALGNIDGAAYALEGLIAIAVLEHDIERAGVLTGAAEAVRRLTGMGEQATIVTFEPFVESVLATEAATAFESARARGRAMTVREATRVRPRACRPRSPECERDSSRCCAAGVPVMRKLPTHRFGVALHGVGAP